MSYKEAMKEVKEKDAYRQYQNQLTRTVDISLDSEVEPPPSPPKKKKKKNQLQKKNKKKDYQQNKTKANPKSS